MIFSLRCSSSIPVCSSSAYSVRYLAAAGIYALSLHGALPISPIAGRSPTYIVRQLYEFKHGGRTGGQSVRRADRSEEHTPELQSPVHLVCGLLPEKKIVHRSERCDERMFVTAHCDSRVTQLAR